MPTRLSSHLQVQQSELEKKGVYDGLIDFDSQLHIDPALLNMTGIVEFIGARTKVQKYFTKIFKILNFVEKENDSFWKAAFKMLNVGEGLNTALGYSKTKAKGSGLGPTLTKSILQLSRKVQAAGNEDPELFELVGVFESNVGADRISDLMTVILVDEFCAYTNRVCHELMIPLRKYKVREKHYDLPIGLNGKYFVFVPHKMLSELPTAENWDDIGIASNYSDEVRKKLNNIIGESWKDAKKAKKEELKKLVLEHPEIVTDIIKQYRLRTGQAYDFVIDHLGDMLWDKIGYQIAKQNQLKIAKSPKDKDELFKIVHVICDKYKDLVENNRLSEAFYDLNNKKRPERFPQLVFFAVADSYCDANNLDISREVNNGAGALDFKLSIGLDKVTVELKYTSNPKLVEGYEKQLEAYNKAEKVSQNYSIYLVIKVNDTISVNNKLAKIRSYISESTRLKQRCPSMIIVDAIRKPSASKL